MAVTCGNLKTYSLRQCNYELIVMSLACDCIGKRKL